ncbi:MAG: chemotaxis protein, partial [Gammaproteobacteria bacterium]|nr:chemotaxis protein [Gammaproteobacteria bacterium]
KKHDYPEYDEHCKQHDEMKQKIDEFIEQFDNEDVAVSKSALHYLENWLSNHICITDKKYTDFLTSKGES